MLEVVKTPYNTADTFYSNIEETQNIIRLCAPYIKTQIVEEILNRKNRDANLIVVTSSNLPVFATGGSDLEAIRTLLANGIRVYNYQDLHAKIYIFDDERALITSANLTYSGFHRNYEYGVMLDDNDVVSQIRTDFIEMIESEDSGEFDIAKLNEISSMIVNIDRIPSVTLTDDGLPLLSRDDVVQATMNLSGWKRDVFDIILEMESNQFSTTDLRTYTNELQILHPNNNNVDAKVRQVLQQLRDLGLIRFTSRGSYIKLWEDQLE